MKVLHKLYKIIHGLCITCIYVGLYSYLTWESCEKSDALGEKLHIPVHHVACQEGKTL